MSRKTLPLQIINVTTISYVKHKNQNIHIYMTYIDNVIFFIITTYRCKIVTTESEHINMFESHIHLVPI